MRDLLNLRRSKARTIRACELIGPGAMRTETGPVKRPFFLVFFFSSPADAIFIYVFRLLTFVPLILLHCDVAYSI